MGAELRRRRDEAGITQSELGGTLSRAFISSVERGRILPSLAALLLLADRLDLSLDSFFAGVNNHMTTAYTSAHERREDSPSRRR